MTPRIMVPFVMVLVLASLAHAQSWPQPFKLEMEINDLNVQAEEQKPGEIEGDENRDLHFDLEITSTADRPKQSNRLPNVDEVKDLYDRQKDQVIQEAKIAGDDISNAAVSIKGGYEYYNLFDWRKKVLKCCPAKDKYQCQGTDVRMPCFYHKYDPPAEWCCPIWPAVQIRKCKCCKCAVLTSACAYQGTCRRRYSKRSFIAVCYRNGRWGYLRYVTKWLPTSCYCRF